MSNHNYSQYSNNKKHHNPNNNHNNYNNAPKHIAYNQPASSLSEAAPEVVAPIAETVVPVVETVETVTLPKTVEGVVVGCTKLNVRCGPSSSAEVVCVLDAMSEVVIDVDKSTNEWFHVCTATGIEGYCVRRFMEAHM